MDDGQGVADLHHVEVVGLRPGGRHSFDAGPLAGPGAAVVGRGGPAYLCVDCDAGLGLERTGLRLAVGHLCRQSQSRRMSGTTAGEGEDVLLRRGLVAAGVCLLLPGRGAVHSGALVDLDGASGHGLGTDRGDGLPLLGRAVGQLGGGEPDSWDR